MSPTPEQVEALTAALSEYWEEYLLNPTCANSVKHTLALIDLSRFILALPQFQPVDMGPIIAACQLAIVELTRLRDVCCPDDAHLIDAAISSIEHAIQKEGK